MSILYKALSIFFVLFFFLGGCTFGPVFGGDVPIGPRGIIYEQDDRLDYYEIKDQTIIEQAKSCPVIMYSSALIEKDDGSFTVSPYTSADGSLFTYGQRYNFDKITQKFSNQPMAGSCSSFLVAPNIVITAGHCVHGKSEHTLSKMRFVFGFWMESKTSTEFNLPSDNVYSVKRIVHYEYNRLTSVDFAVIELDRDVTVAEPLKVSIESAEKGDAVYIIGYPNGLPLKYSPNANVFRSNSKSFVASLDAFQGNSGSPVFNSNGEVTGVYISTYLLLIGTDYYGRLKPWGATPTDLSGNKSTHAKHFISHIP